MNIEQLRALLEKGEITQEEFDQKVAELEGKGGNEEEGLDLNKLLENEDFKKFLQSEVDKVRTKYVNEKKGLEKELNDLRTKSMTKEEILTEKENELKTLAAQLKKRELDIETSQLLEERKLPSSFLGFVVGENIEERTKSIENLTNLVDQTATIKAEEKFKSQGTDFDKGSNTDNGAEFSKMTPDEKIEFLRGKSAEEQEKYLSQL